MNSTATPAENTKAGAIEWAEKMEAQLKEISNKHGDRIVQFLSLANGGAAVALASLIGTDRNIRQSIYSWSAETFFFVGIIFVGCLIGHQYWLIESLHRDLIADLERMESQEIPPEDVGPNHNKRAKRRKWPSDIFGLLSFLSFVAGTFLALWLLPRAIGLAYLV